MNSDQLSMSKFASRADFYAAVSEREGYHPEDAFADGESARLEPGFGSGKNPYSADTQPICHAAWLRAFNGARA